MRKIIEKWKAKRKKAKVEHPIRSSGECLGYEAMVHFETFEKVERKTKQKRRIL